MKNQKGITLVALVITIIVLLILAGVSISLVVGQNGVLTQATGSVAANKAAAAKQAVSLSLAACETKYYTQWVGNQAITRASVFTATEVGNELTKQGYTATFGSATTVVGSSDVEITLTSGKDTIYVNVKVDETSGKVEFGDIKIKDKTDNILVNNI